MPNGQKGIGLLNSDKILTERLKMLKIWLYTIFDAQIPFVIQNPSRNFKLNILIKLFAISMVARSAKSKIKITTAAGALWSAHAI